MSTALVAAFQGGTSVADIADRLDADGTEYGICDAALVGRGGHRRFAGRVRTVRCHEDNVVLRSLLEQPGDAAVCIVDGGGSERVALLGDNVADVAVSNGWAGIVLYGAVRDAAELRDIPIGISSLGTCPRRSAKEGHGEKDVEVTFGGVTFRPGDFVFADEDGLLVTSGSGE